MKIIATFEYLEDAWDEAAKLIALHPGKLYDVMPGNTGFDVREFLEDHTPMKETVKHERKHSAHKRSTSKS